MRTISLSRNHEAVIDDEDFDRLSAFKWRLSRKLRPYVVRPMGFGDATIPMQNEVLGVPKGQIVDHKNGNPFDNQKQNLRPATLSQNRANSKLNKNNKVGLKGVSFYDGKFRARIGSGIAGRATSLGTFGTAQEAHAAYIEAARKQFGEFARAS